MRLNPESRVKNLKIFQSFYSGEKKINTIIAFLLQRKLTSTEDVPGLFFILATANYSFQIVIPGYSGNKHLYGKEVVFPPFPLPLLPNTFERITHKIVDLSSTQRTSAAERNHTFFFERAEEESIPPTEPN